MERISTSVTIPDTVSKIGQIAFAECTSLSTVTIPAAIQEIPYAAFANCRKLTSITAPGVKKIDDYAFQGCEFSDFEIGKNVTELSSLAFFNSKIATFSVEPGNTKFTAAGGVLYTDNGKSLFAYPAGNHAESFAIPSTVTKVCSAAFQGASYLQRVDIPNSVTELESSAFQQAGLASVTIPDSITTVGDFTFYGSAVKTVTFGKGIVETSYQMFRECPNLTMINFPATSLILGAHTFAYCPSLEIQRLGLAASKSETCIVGYKTLAQRHLIQWSSRLTEPSRSRSRQPWMSLAKRRSI